MSAEETKDQAEDRGKEDAGADSGTETSTEKGTETDSEAPPPALTALLLQTFPGQVLQHHVQHGDETVVLQREKMLGVFAFLKSDPRCKFEMMIDLTAVDRMPRQPRFDVVYHLKSLTLTHRLRVKIPVGGGATGEEALQVDTIRELWIAADWYERECHEMYGIDFAGHPNLKPLLLYEGFQGYPLRKDYEKGRSQPLVPLRPVRERYDYGETFHPVPTQEN